MGKHVAVYCRVSSRKQDHRSQLPDLKRWAESQDRPVRWYRDTQSGKTLDRPGWERLEADLNAGKIGTICCWRLDRLGRTASGLTRLFDDLRERKVNLVSLRDNLDLSTASGRLFANMLASIAQYESELKGERVVAGQAVARANGKTWGGRKPGTRIRLTVEKERQIHRMYNAGESIAAIARTVELSRPTCYRILAAASK
jgi:DNA invertase Pin-like site-specific DNA recombinase